MARKTRRQRRTDTRARREFWGCIGIAAAFVFVGLPLTVAVGTILGTSFLVH